MSRKIARKLLGEYKNLTFIQWIRPSHDPSIVVAPSKWKGWTRSGRKNWGFLAWFTLLGQRLVKCRFAWWSIVVRLLSSRWYDSRSLGAGFREAWLTYAFCRSHFCVCSTPLKARTLDGRGSLLKALASSQRNPWRWQALVLFKSSSNVSTSLSV